MSFNYIKYWENTYQTGGTSGDGSYGVLAAFKAEVINTLCLKHGVQKVIEFGCGDGNQLQLMNYPEYLGLDVASSSIKLCAEKFKEDDSKSFLQYVPGAFVNKGFLQADLVVCLDVLYHITDEEDFKATLQDIFQASTQFVILYTRITDGTDPQVIDTIKDRDIMSYLSQFSDFKIVEIIPQRYKELSSADFIIFRKVSD
ncbi:class I SAM-dependent methyltransferase [Bacillus horti]|uniref:SAM-dependent methyltransferase n=1 Tax=Caldalkalibacillus horti TaxID=77523 RepID=A0ABT9VVE3_9BACI|nr:class I SAM-dependent methyltransferase [Bacillus horti]MDQ0164962.1 SAM-dependent methyltransferase [Bacillus horti]